ncbi:MAG: rhomboid family intramembrane serine protease [Candidatus Krumholzibacteriia bacterium]
MPRQTGAMLCPSCRKLISVDEPRCPYCGAVRPGLWGWGPVLQRLFGGRLELVPVISMACIGLYVLALLVDVRGALGGGGMLTLLSPSRHAQFLLGMTGRLLIDAGHWWTLFTAIYLHGGLIHIFFNVLCIRRLGSFAEDELGPARFFVLFSLAGAGGFLLSSLMNNPLTLGASGSVFGIVGAIIAFRRRRGRGGDMISQQLLVWVGFLFVLGFFVPVVDNWAHAGGFVTGYALGHRFHGIHEKPEGRSVQLLALGVLAVTVLGFVLSIVKWLPTFLSL